MRRKITLGYAFFAYAVFIGSFVYGVGFLSDVLVPRTVDSGPMDPFATALAVDLGLIALFGLQHSVMARPGFKRWWTRFVPEHLERSTYVLLASVTLLLVFWLWRPIPGEIWTVEATWARWSLWALYGAGWAGVYVAGEAIDSDHLMGVSQVRDHLEGEEISSPGFQTPGPYRFVRHPIQLSFLVAFWATPRMTVGHIVFSAGMTLYILVGLLFEERDLVRSFGDRYLDYRQRVPKLIPGVGVVARKG